MREAFIVAIVVAYACGNLHLMWAFTAASCIVGIVAQVSTHARRRGRLG